MVTTFSRFSLFVCWKARQVRLFVKGACLCVLLSRMFAHPSIRKHIFAWSSIREHIYLHALAFCLLLNLSFCMFSPSFILLFIAPCFFVYLFLEPLMTRRYKIQKPPNLPWYMITSYESDWERKQGCEVGWRLWALLMKSAQASLGDGDGNSGSTVTVCEVWPRWRTKLCNFWGEQSGLQEGNLRSFSNEQAVGPDSKNCAIFYRNKPRCMEACQIEIT